jgi:cysteinyl-tRNA synthetase
MSEKEIHIYNTLSRKKELFKAIKSPNLGLYVCGPTVYGDPHLGHARPAVCFDVVYRFFMYMGYEVRYVRNITDVGHLENDADEGEDKIAKKARTEQLEPMEVAKYYTDRYHQAMRALNTLNPSIEPTASGHIMEQIEMTQAILDAGFAYEVNGSVYFDVLKYNESHDYGKLSGRKLEELLEGSRVLSAQEDKRNSQDFALWKKAEPKHIMRWKSPWGEGFPGWHIECSVMSTKYLGETFDIHGGGMDLKFPHHECEIAQSVGACGNEPVRYWMHNNMITVNGQKMGKSLGNFITLEAFFTGEHKLLEQQYSPMTIRFFMLQTHYRSTIDFSNHGLQSAQKGMEKLLNALSILNQLSSNESADKDKKLSEKINTLFDQAINSMCDDFNTPQLVARLFELSAIINSLYHGKIKASELSNESLEKFKLKYRELVVDVLGLEELKDDDSSKLNDVMELVIDIRKDARAQKNFEISDKIRDRLSEIKIQLKDEKDDKTSWTVIR